MEIRKSRNGVIVGIFIVVALAIFVLAVFILGGEKKTFSRKIPLKVVFTDINGLKEGNNIWFSGVKIGTVKKIKLKGFANVEVTLNVEESAQPYIHQDAAARIGNDGLLGNKIVLIYGGTSGLPVVEANSYLGVQKVNPEEDMMALLNRSNKNLLEITNNLKAVSKKIADGEGTAGKLINDPSIANSLLGTLDNFKAVSANSKKAIAGIQEFINHVNTEASSLNKLLRDTSFYDSVKASMAQIKKVTGIANDFANNINEFAVNIKTASAGLKDSATPAGMLLNDKGVALHLESTIKNLESASKKLDEDLEAVRHNFLFRGYFRKKQKNADIAADSMQHN
jgi:phospholipid/cholesterol/gamma-HCH transport system substrate-binding protein